MHRSTAPFILVLGLLPLASLAGSNQAAAVPVASGPQSVFVDEVDFGKDPFFPRSVRRPKVHVKRVETQRVLGVVPDWVVIKGISALKDKKLAIVNNYTVGEGEEFSLRAGAQSIKLKCVEIKESSVVLSMDGATREIPLRSRP